MLVPKSYTGFSQLALSVYTTFLSFNVDLHKEIQQLQAAHADTINELEKTRSMLIIQHKINKDYQKEVRSNYKTLE